MTSTENESVDPQAWLLEQASLRDVLAEVTATWGDSRLAIRYYLGDSPPPSSLVTSVRAVLFHEQTVMMAQDGAHTYHVMPGGRREPGETIESTLRRELLEETGWRVASHHPFGFAHFRHLTPRPADYPYPIPTSFSSCSSLRQVNRSPMRSKANTSSQPCSDPSTKPWAC
jgi:8-oxo-dGTP pyrophosphatase MutT (NUDIX family)